MLPNPCDIRPDERTIFGSLLYLCHVLPVKLHRKIEQRKAANAFRSLGDTSNLIDFASNDYLGFSASEYIYEGASEWVARYGKNINGATGSRLLSGNHPMFEIAEQKIAAFHNTEAAIIFNSGYDANIGFFGSVPQRGDVIFYDELCHASIRDGIRMSHAKASKFKHNRLDDLEKQLSIRAASRTSDEVWYVVTEAVFSMDGDRPDLKTLVEISKKYDGLIVLDEAHALGVVGKRGVGLVQDLALEDQVFARLVTFGKALGCHGAAILGCDSLRKYLLNFARSFVYTTALPPHSVGTILAAYDQLKNDENVVAVLQENISYMKQMLHEFSIKERFVPSDTSIQSCLIPGNSETKLASRFLHDHGFDVKPILAPTVPEGQERIRICLHANNTKASIRQLVQRLAEHLNKNPEN